jgi:hypothetical protein
LGSMLLPEDREAAETLLRAARRSGNSEHRRAAERRIEALARGYAAAKASNDNRRRELAALYHGRALNLLDRDEEAAEPLRLAAATKDMEIATEASLHLGLALLGSDIEAAGEALEQSWKPWQQQADDAITTVVALRIAYSPW